MLSYHHEHTGSLLFSNMFFLIISTQFTFWPPPFSSKGWHSFILRIPFRNKLFWWESRLVYYLLIYINKWMTVLLVNFHLVWLRGIVWSLTLRFGRCVLSFFFSNLQICSLHLEFTSLFSLVCSPKQTLQLLLCHFPALVTNTQSLTLNSDT